MADKKKSQSKQVTDIKKKPTKAADTNVKGGGPGTQTEDDVYVGVKAR